jgi:hypothetical protein
MKQTAVEWFLTEFQKQVWFEPNSELDIWIKELIPKAKEMEKEQIIEAWNTGTYAYNNGEDYYNETYNV